MGLKSKTPHSTTYPAFKTTREREKCMNTIFVQKRQQYHTAGLDTIFVQIYMDVLPGVPGVSKNQIFFYK